MSCKWTHIKSFSIREDYVEKWGWWLRLMCFEDECFPNCNRCLNFHQYAGANQQIVFLENMACGIEFRWRNRIWEGLIWDMLPEQALGAGRIWIWKCRDVKGGGKDIQDRGNHMCSGMGHRHQGAGWVEQTFWFGLKVEYVCVLQRPEAGVRSQMTWTCFGGQ